MLVYLLGVLPGMGTTQVTNPWIAVLSHHAMMAFHPGKSSNLTASISDVFRKHAVGAVAGSGTTVGSIGAIRLLYLNRDFFKVEHATDAKADAIFTMIFLGAGLAYRAALTCCHLLVPKISP